MSNKYHALMAGALSGFIPAATVDFQAFRAWKCWHDAATYDWKTALFRWAQGAIMGALTSLGIFSLS